MLSIVLYGRNDSYGYNLHKRAALGLNCIAEILDDPEDEILFVDYNTPDDYPTFPEAIADTLTAKVHQRLRIFRVRPALHQRFAGRTHLKALEPIARNVAIRRSNVANRWILSTNTDMIFVLRGGTSLSEVVRTLPDAYYHLPRFELPESLWEGFNRLDPVAVMRQVEQYGRSLFLNEITYGYECIKYDAPGDFQLILRDDLFAIDGFDEEMLLGWHVDSNIAKRLFLRYREVGDASGALLGYHCDHTRQVTPAHERKAPCNDIARFFDDVTSSPLPAQRDSWGCPDERIEEIRLDRSMHKRYLDVLSDPVAFEQAQPRLRTRTYAATEQAPYDARHVLPFLLDAFAAAPRSVSVGWVGGRDDLLRAFSTAWRRLGFTEPLLIDQWSTALFGPLLPDGVRAVTTAEIEASVEILIVDFGAPSASGSGRELSAYDEGIVDELFEDFVRDRFTSLTESEAMRLRAGAVPRRVLCIDGLNNRYTQMVEQHLAAANAPFSLRLRQGFVNPMPDTVPVVRSVWGVPDLATSTTQTIDLLPMLQVAKGGRRSDQGIVAPFGSRGYVFRGPFHVLPFGDYRVEFTLAPRSLLVLAGMMKPVIVDAVLGADRIAESRETFKFRKVVWLSFAIPFPEPVRAIDLRIFRGRFIDFIVTNATLTRTTSPRVRFDTDPNRTPSPQVALSATRAAAL